MARRYNPETGQYEDQFEGDERPDRGIPASRFTPEETDFLRNNPGDYGRMNEALGNTSSPSPAPAPSPAPTTTTAAPTSAPRAPSGVPQAWFDDFVRRNPGDAHRAAEAYGSTGGTSTGGDSRTQALERVSQTYSAPPPVQNTGVTDLLAYLKEQDAGRASQQADVRKMLMEQWGAASKPVDINDPALKAQLDPQRLALQRSGERKRSMLAARRW